MKLCLLLPLTVLFMLAANTTMAQHYAHLPDSVYKGDPVTNCGTCHGASASARLNKVPAWLTTNHARAYDSIPSSERAFLQNSQACLRCHTTGWDTTKANGGFDDYFRHTPQNHADTVGILKTRNVQCESCHKPYAATGVGYDTSFAAAKCGACHGGDPHTPIYENWQLSKHAFSKYTSIPGNSFRFIASDPNCAGCHTAEGFLQWIGQSGISPNIIPADTTKSSAITCAACHNPHGSSNAHQLRMPIAQICQKCHNPEYPADSVKNAVGGEVHHSTAYMFEGKGGYHYAGVTYQNSLHTVVVTNKCVTCHVHATPFVSDTLPAYTGHTFTPHKAACKTCHADLDTTAANPKVFDYRRTQTVSDSLAGILNSLLATAHTHGDSTSTGFLRAKFNYDFYEGDGSHGIHNTKYAQALLTSAISHFSLTGVEEEKPTTPLIYELRQNYPNPFNPSTTINFSIARKEFVRLEIYDIVGRSVVTLVNEEMAPGSYRVVWNGADRKGVKVASGLYLYKLEAGSFSSTKKMVLLK